MRVRKTQPFSQRVSPLPSQKGTRGDEEKEGETLSPLAHNRAIGCHQMPVVPLVPTWHNVPCHPAANQPHHPQSSLQWEQNFQTALLLLWSKPLIIFKPVYRYDCILPCSFLFLFSLYSFHLLYFFPSVSFTLLHHPLSFPPLAPQLLFSSCFPLLNYSVASTIFFLPLSFLLIPNLCLFIWCWGWLMTFL